MDQKTVCIPRFGDIYYARLTGGENIQKGTRPVVIAQNDVGNKYSTTVEVIPMSTRIHKARYMPTHVLIHPDGENGLPAASVVLAEQVVTINKKDLVSFIGILNMDCLKMIGQARRVQSPFPT